MKWMGPFKVVQRVNDVAYELELPKPWKIHKVFHVSLLKPYHKGGRHQPPPPALLVEGEEEFEVFLFFFFFFFGWERHSLQRCNERD